MKFRLFCVSLLALLFSSCGDKPEPDTLEGEETAAQYVTSFMKAVEFGDFSKAASYLHSNPDANLKDLQYCRDLFFHRKASGMAVLGVGHEVYGNEWHIAVDLKINYGDLMKKLRFTLAPGNPPKLRGVSPLKE